MGLFNLFGGSTSVASIEQYLDNGAVIIDVRTIEEFQEGHVQGSRKLGLIPGVFIEPVSVMWVCGYVCIYAYIYI